MPLRGGALSAQSITSPQAGFLPWATHEIEPVLIRGQAPPGATSVRYTIQDKGIVMGQGSLIPEAGGAFSLVYDPETLHQTFPMLSLTAHEGLHEGLADEVAISLLATGAAAPRAARITLIGEQVFVVGEPGGGQSIFLPMVLR